MEPVTVEKPVSELKPLDVKCSETRCAEGFHYYTSLATRKDGKIGDCKSCGDDSIDWEKVHAGAKNVDYMFDCLKKELLRHVCWVNSIDDSAIVYAKKRGKKEVLIAAKNIITKKIAKIPTTHWDNLCTPKTGKEIVNYAQHATATCCRKCVERWHNIPKDVVLSEGQVDYFVQLIGLYIDEKIPELTEGAYNSYMLKL